MDAESSTIKAAGFYTGTKPPEVTDARKYNRSVAILRFTCAGLFGLPGGVQLNPRSGLMYKGSALCRSDGRPGSISGFVTLNEDDCANIYWMML